MILVTFILRLCDDFATSGIGVGDGEAERAHKQREASVFGDKRARRLERRHVAHKVLAFHVVVRLARRRRSLKCPLVAARRRLVAANRNFLNALRPRPVEATEQAAHMAATKLARFVDKVYTGFAAHSVRLTRRSRVGVGRFVN